VSRARHVGRDGRDLMCWSRLSLLGRPHRLAAQVTALSRLQRGFESRWGHSSRADASLSIPRYGLRREATDQPNEEIVPNSRPSVSVRAESVIERAQAASGTVSDVEPKYVR
jgi:hypothetical protein